MNADVNYFNTCASDADPPDSKVNECPRCGGRLYTIPGDGGAMSRADDRVAVCADCGVDEAVLDSAGRRGLRLKSARALLRTWREPEWTRRRPDGEVDNTSAAVTR